MTCAMRTVYRGVKGKCAIKNRVPSAETYETYARHQGYDEQRR